MKFYVFCEGKATAVCNTRAEADEIMKRWDSDYEEPRCTLVFGTILKSADTKLKPFGSGS